MINYAKLISNPADHVEVNPSKIPINGRDHSQPIKAEKKTGSDKQQIDLFHGIYNYQQEDTLIHDKTKQFLTSKNRLSTDYKPAGMDTVFLKGAGDRNHDRYVNHRSAMHNVIEDQLEALKDCATRDQLASYINELNKKFAGKGITRLWNQTDYPLADPLASERKRNQVMDHLEKVSLLYKKFGSDYMHLITSTHDVFKLVDDANHTMYSAKVVWESGIVDRYAAVLGDKKDIFLPVLFMHQLLGAGFTNGSFSLLINFSQVDDPNLTQIQKQIQLLMRDILSDETKKQDFYDLLYLLSYIDTAGVTEKGYLSDTLVQNYDIYLQKIKSVLDGNDMSPKGMSDRLSTHVDSGLYLNFFKWMTSMYVNDVDDPAFKANFSDAFIAKVIDKLKSEGMTDQQLGDMIKSAHLIVEQGYINTTSAALVVQNRGVLPVKDGKTDFAALDISKVDFTVDDVAVAFKHNLLLARYAELKQEKDSTKKFITYSRNNDLAPQFFTPEEVNSLWMLSDEVFVAQFAEVLEEKGIDTLFTTVKMFSDTYGSDTYHQAMGQTEQAGGDKSLEGALAEHGFQANEIKSFKAASMCLWNLLRNPIRAGMTFNKSVSQLWGYHAEKLPQKVEEFIKVQRLLKSEADNILLSDLGLTRDSLDKLKKDAYEAIGKKYKPSDIKHINAIVNYRISSENPVMIQSKPALLMTAWNLGIVTSFIQLGLITATFMMNSNISLLKQFMFNLFALGIVYYSVDSPLYMLSNIDGTITRKPRIQKLNKDFNERMSVADINLMFGGGFAYTVFNFMRSRIHYGPHKKLIAQTGGVGAKAFPNQACWDILNGFDIRTKAIERLIRPLFKDKNNEYLKATVDFAPVDMNKVRQILDTAGLGASFDTIWKDLLGTYSISKDQLILKTQPSTVDNLIKAIRLNNRDAAQELFELMDESRYAGYGEKENREGDNWALWQLSGSLAAPNIIKDTANTVLHSIIQDEELGYDENSRVSAGNYWRLFKQKFAGVDSHKEGSLIIEDVLREAAKRLPQRLRDKGLADESEIKKTCKRIVLALENNMRSIVNSTSLEEFYEQDIFDEKLESILVAQAGEPNITQKISRNDFQYLLDVLNEKITSEVIGGKTIDPKESVNGARIDYTLKLQLHDQILVDYCVKQSGEHAKIWNSWKPTAWVNAMITGKSSDKLQAQAASLLPRLWQTKGIDPIYAKALAKKFRREVYKRVIAPGNLSEVSQQLLNGKTILDIKKGYLTESHFSRFGSVKSSIVASLKAVSFIDQAGNITANYEKTPLPSLGEAFTESIRDLVKAKDFSYAVFGEMASDVQSIVTADTDIDRTADQVALIIEKAVFKIVDDNKLDIAIEKFKQSAMILGYISEEKSEEILRVLESNARQINEITKKANKDYVELDTAGKEKQIQSYLLDIEDHMAYVNYADGDYRGVSETRDCNLFNSVLYHWEQFRNQLLKLGPLESAPLLSKYAEHKSVIEQLFENIEADVLVFKPTVTKEAIDKLAGDNPPQKLKELIEVLQKAYMEDKQRIMREFNFSGLNGLTSRVKNAIAQIKCTLNEDQVKDIINQSANSFIGVLSEEKVKELIKVIRENRGLIDEYDEIKGLDKKWAPINNQLKVILTNSGFDADNEAALRISLESITFYFINTEADEVIAGSNDLMNNGKFNEKNKFDLVADGLKGLGNILNLEMFAGYSLLSEGQQKEFKKLLNTETISALNKTFYSAASQEDSVDKRFVEFVSFIEQALLNVMAQDQGKGPIKMFNPCDELYAVMPINTSNPDALKNKDGILVTEGELFRKFDFMPGTDWKALITELNGLLNTNDKSLSGGFDDNRLQLKKLSEQENRLAVKILRKYGYVLPITINRASHYENMIRLLMGELWDRRFLDNENAMLAHLFGKEMGKLELIKEDYEAIGAFINAIGTDDEPGKHNAIRQEIRGVSDVFRGLANAKKLDFDQIRYYIDQEWEKLANKNLTDIASGFYWKIYQGGVTKSTFNNILNNDKQAAAVWDKLVNSGIITVDKSNNQVEARIILSVTHANKKALEAALREIKVDDVVIKVDNGVIKKLIKTLQGVSRENKENLEAGSIQGLTEQAASIAVETFLDVQIMRRRGAGSLKQYIGHGNDTVKEIAQKLVADKCRVVKKESVIGGIKTYEFSNGAYEANQQYKTTMLDLKNKIKGLTAHVNSNSSDEEVRRRNVLFAQRDNLEKKMLLPNVDTISSLISAQDHSKYSEDDDINRMVYSSIAEKILVTLHNGFVTRSSFESFGDEKKDIWDALIEAAYITPNGTLTDKITADSKETFKGEEKFSPLVMKKIDMDQVYTILKTASSIGLMKGDLVKAAEGVQLSLTGEKVEVTDKLGNNLVFTVSAEHGADYARIISQALSERSNKAASSQLSKKERVTYIKIKKELDVLDGLGKNYESMIQGIVQSLEYAVNIGRCNRSFDKNKGFSAIRDEQYRFFSDSLFSFEKLQSVVWAIMQGGDLVLENQSLGKRAIWKDHTDIFGKNKDSVANHIDNYIKYVTDQAETDYQEADANARSQEEKRIALTNKEQRIIQIKAMKAWLESFKLTQDLINNSGNESIRTSARAVRDSLFEHIDSIKGVSSEQDKIRKIYDRIKIDTVDRFNNRIDPAMDLQLIEYTYQFLSDKKEVNEAVIEALSEHLKELKSKIMAEVIGRMDNNFEKKAGNLINLGLSDEVRLSKAASDEDRINEMADDIRSEIIKAPIVQLHIFDVDFYAEGAGSKGSAQSSALIGRERNVQTSVFMGEVLETALEEHKGILFIPPDLEKEAEEFITSAIVFEGDDFAIKDELGIDTEQFMLDLIDRITNKKQQPEEAAKEIVRSWGLAGGDVYQGSGKMRKGWSLRNAAGMGPKYNYKTIEHRLVELADEIAIRHYALGEMEGIAFALRELYFEAKNKNYQIYEDNQYFAKAKKILINYQEKNGKSDFSLNDMNVALNEYFKAQIIEGDWSHISSNEISSQILKEMQYLYAKMSDDIKKVEELQKYDNDKIARQVAKEIHNELTSTGSFSRNEELLSRISDAVNKTQDAGSISQDIQKKIDNLYKALATERQRLFAKKAKKEKLEGQKKSLKKGIAKLDNDSIDLDSQIRRISANKKKQEFETKTGTISYNYLVREIARKEKALTEINYKRKQLVFDLVYEQVQSDIADLDIDLELAQEKAKIEPVKYAEVILALEKAKDEKLSLFTYMLYLKPANEGLSKIRKNIAAVDDNIAKLDREIENQTDNINSLKKEILKLEKKAKGSGASAADASKELEKSKDKLQKLEAELLAFWEKSQSSFTAQMAKLTYLNNDLTIAESGIISKSIVLARIPEIEHSLGKFFENPEEEALVFKPKMEEYINDYSLSKKAKKELLSILNLSHFALQSQLAKLNKNGILVDKDVDYFEDIIMNYSKGELKSAEKEVATVQKAVHTLLTTIDNESNGKPSAILADDINAQVTAQLSKFEEKLAEITEQRYRKNLNGILQHIFYNHKFGRKLDTGTPLYDVANELAVEIEKEFEPLGQLYANMDADNAQDVMAFINESLGSQFASLNNKNLREYTSCTVFNTDGKQLLELNEWLSHSEEYTQKLKDLAGHLNYTLRIDGNWTKAHWAAQNARIQPRTAMEKHEEYSDHFSLARNVASFAGMKKVSRHGKKITREYAVFNRPRTLKQVAAHISSRIAITEEKSSMMPLFWSNNGHWDPMAKALYDMGEMGDEYGWLNEITEQDRNGEHIHKEMARLTDFARSDWKAQWTEERHDYFWLYRNITTPTKKTNAQVLDAVDNDNHMTIPFDDTLTSWKTSSKARGISHKEGRVLNDSIVLFQKPQGRYDYTGEMGRADEIPQTTFNHTFTAKGAPDTTRAASFHAGCYNHNLVRGTIGIAQSTNYLESSQFGQNSILNKAMIKYWDIAVSPFGFLLNLMLHPVTTTSKVIPKIANFDYLSIFRFSSYKLKQSLDPNNLTDDQNNRLQQMAGRGINTVLRRFLGDFAVPFFFVPMAIMAAGLLPSYGAAVAIGVPFWKGFKYILERTAYFDKGNGLIPLIKSYINKNIELKEKQAEISERWKLVRANAGQVAYYGAGAFLGFSIYILGTALFPPMAGFSFTSLLSNEIAWGITGALSAMMATRKWKEQGMFNRTKHAMGWASANKFFSHIKGVKALAAGVNKIARGSVKIQYDDPVFFNNTFLQQKVYEMAKKDPFDRGGEFGEVTVWRKYKYSLEDSALKAVTMALYRISDGIRRSDGGNPKETGMRGKIFRFGRWIASGAVPQHEAKIHDNAQKKTISEHLQTINMVNYVYSFLIRLLVYPALHLYLGYDASIIPFVPMNLGKDHFNIDNESASSNVYNFVHLMAIMAVSNMQLSKYTQTKFLTMEGYTQKQADFILANPNLLSQILAADGLKKSRYFDNFPSDAFNPSTPATGETKEMQVVELEDRIPFVNMFRDHPIGLMRTMMVLETIAATNLLTKFASNIGRGWTQNAFDLSLLYWIFDNQKGLDRIDKMLQEEGSYAKYELISPKFKYAAKSVRLFGATKSSPNHGLNGIPRQLIGILGYTAVSSVIAMTMSAAAIAPGVVIGIFSTLGPLVGVGVLYYLMDSLPKPQYLARKFKKTLNEKAFPSSVGQENPISDWVALKSYYFGVKIKDPTYAFSALWDQGFDRFKESSADTLIKISKEIDENEVRKEIIAQVKNAQAIAERGTKCKSIVEGKKSDLKQLAIDGFADSNELKSIFSAFILFNQLTEQKDGQIENKNKLTAEEITKGGLSAKSAGIISFMLTHTNSFGTIHDTTKKSEDFLRQINNDLEQLQLDTGISDDDALNILKMMGAYAISADIALPENILSMTNKVHKQFMKKEFELGVIKDNRQEKAEYLYKYFDHKIENAQQQFSTEDPLLTEKYLREGAVRAIKKKSFRTAVSFISQLIKAGIASEKDFIDQITCFQELKQLEQAKQAAEDGLKQFPLSESLRKRKEYIELQLRQPLL